MSRLPLPKKAGLPASFKAPPTIEVEEEEDVDDDMPLSTVGGIDSIKVCVRIRPMIRDDRDASEILAWRWDKQTISQDKFPGKNSSSPTNKPPENAAVPSYTFDHIFLPEDTNDIIYDSVIRSVVSNCMEGYHGSVFSYGQTSSGKTFTMNGTSKQPGVIPLAVYDCFSMIDEYNDREFLFRASYLEVYNEQVKDLLNPDPIHSNNIKIQHDPKVGTVISGIKEQVVANAQQVMALLQGGESHRHVGATNMNEKSSRAHTIFRLKIESKERFANTSVRTSTLNLIDLAGSENARMTGATGDRAKESKYINQSLLTLSTIIQRLSEESTSTKRQHLPYRDSKLTRILQEPLSGNALIAVICTMSPALRCADESNNTLRFATRAKKVQMAKAAINEDVDDKALLKAYRQEIEMLKAKLAEISETEPKAAARRVEVEDEEGKEKLLQMIEDMERFIVKADLLKAEHSAGDAPKSRRHSIDPHVALKSSSRPQSPNGSLHSPKGPSPLQSGAIFSVVPSFEVLERKDGALHSRSFKNLSIDPDAAQTEASTEMQESLGDSPTRRPRAIFSAEPFETAIAEEETDARGFFEAPAVMRRASQEASSMPRRTSLFRDTSHPHPASTHYTPDRRRSYVATVQSGEHILLGVAQMLQSLKAQVSKASLGPPPEKIGVGSPSRMASTEDEIETLKLDIKLKDADSRFLQEELEKKDRIMEELTEGLKEVAITHEQWAEDLCEAQLAYEAQTRECDLLRQRIEYLEEVARAHDALKARVQILESVLKRKDKQLSELTGIMYSEEDGVAEQRENETSRPSILSMESNVDISMRSWRDVEGEQ